MKKKTEEPSQILYKENSKNSFKEKRFSNFFCFVSSLDFSNPLSNFTSSLFQSAIKYCEINIASFYLRNECFYLPCHCQLFPPSLFCPSVPISLSSYLSISRHELILHEKEIEQRINCSMYLDKGNCETLLETERILNVQNSDLRCSSEINYPKNVKSKVKKKETNDPNNYASLFQKQKTYNKERVRLKTFSVRNESFIYLKNVFQTVYILLALVFPAASQNVQTCPVNCTCETFAIPTASSAQNMWPLLLTSSLLSERLSVPLRNPTKFEALISSILTANPFNEEDLNNQVDNSKAQFQNGSHSRFKTQGFLSSSAHGASLPISPGEVFVDCRDKRHFNNSLIAPRDEHGGLLMVVKLDLSSNYLKTIHKNDLKEFAFLRYLHLDYNELESIVPGMFPAAILHLSLENNHFQSVPQGLESLFQLKILNLARNQLTLLKKEDLPALPSLILLSLHGNNIYELDEHSLQGLPKLQILDLAGNHLSDVPKAIKKCKSLRQILLGDNRITYIGEHEFFGLENLQWVDLQGNPLLDVHSMSFVGLPSLIKLILESVRGLDYLPSLNGTANVEAIRVDRASLTDVPLDLCEAVPKLRSLNLHLNDIATLPNLNKCHNLRLLDLSNNGISSLGSDRFVGVPLLHDLLLQYNFIDYIPKDAFTGLLNLQVLNLEYNRISVIDPVAFLPLISLEDINLGNNQFPELPSVGLERVVNLKAHNNRHLRVFPGPESFPAVHSLVLSYAYHCCPFLSSSDKDDLETSTEFHEDVVYSVDQLHKFDPDIWNHSNVWPHIEGIPTSEFLNVWSKRDGPTAAGTEALSSIYNITTPSTPTVKSILRHLSNRNASRLQSLNETETLNKFPGRSVMCIPQPGPFMPCRDLFDWWTLRCGVWLVFLLALMGNGVVVIVLVSAYSKMDVPRFLVANLALADFFMGIYLGFLAVVDASTLGDFRMYAIPWQMSAGCQLAGFLGVLSSELSVYTLAVITMERNYAITHAMHLNKRLSLPHAAYIMAIGWVFALTMAILPLTGISDYRKFAVCLPFETDGAGLGYIVFLMFINGIAFLILMGCYLKIYCAIRGSQAWNSNDSRIAKRMALLVFTDFICWSPIAFFSLSAAFGLQLISLEGAKVFTVFVLPFNSCCNPFLYALLTKQFKKDCVMLCKAIEESRVTRGIGRCRHSSNFSNRQTPANTNSALDQHSKEDHHTCSCRMKDQHSHKRNIITRLYRVLCCHNDNKSSSAGKSAGHSSRSPMKVARSTTLDSANMSSAWSWRGQAASNLRLLELRRQTTLDLARKSSQESSLSSSRNDSSGTSGSTVTWRISRSSVSSDASSSGTKLQRSGSLKEKNKDDLELTSKLEMGLTGRPGIHGYAKPRLQRQKAVDKDPNSVQVSFGNELRCPLHARIDNLSCVYEQASLEEEDSNEVFLVAQPSCQTHRRSLSDGLLCGTLLSLSAPTPQLITSIAPSLQISKSIAKDETAHAHTYSDSSEMRTESYDEGTTNEDVKPDGLLETHFPLGDVHCEGDPLLRKK